MRHPLLWSIVIYSETPEDDHTLLCMYVACMLSYSAVTLGGSVEEVKQAPLNDALVLKAWSWWIDFLKFSVFICVWHLVTKHGEALQAQLSQKSLSLWISVNTLCLWIYWVHLLICPPPGSNTQKKQSPASKWSSSLLIRFWFSCVGFR